MNVTAHSPAKLIFSGEHSVIYGHPAVVTALPIETEVTVTDDDTYPLQDSDFLKNIFTIFYRQSYFNNHANLEKVTSVIPTGCGLGSSAAVAHAIFKALAELHKVSLSIDELFELVQQSEVFAHGRPSGVDARAVVMGKSLIFRKEKDQLLYQEIDLSCLKKTPWWLINSGTPEETTCEMVAQVLEKRNNNPLKMDHLLNKLGELTNELISQLNDEQFAPELIAINQRYLEELGVVGEFGKRVVSAIETVGGYAKVTGAGGIKKGSGIIMAYHPEPMILQQVVSHLGLPAYKITLS